jgi:hypothetical protein
MVKKIEHKTENGIELKYCGKCKVFKDLSIFGNSSASWDSLRPTCKDCLKENNLNNKEKIHEYNKKYWQETKEEQKAKCKEWRENNKEHIKQKNKNWYTNNIEYVKQKDKEYKEKNWDKIKVRNNLWRKKDYLDMKTNPERKEEFITIFSFIYSHSSYSPLPSFSPRRAASPAPGSPACASLTIPSRDQVSF